MKDIASSGPAPSLRDDLAKVIDGGWQHLSRAGIWWDGAARLAIAAESRQARDCPLCAARKDALSPNMLAGEHANMAGLSPLVIDVIHKVCTDASRISESWVHGLAAQGLSEEAYVELIAVVAQTMALDSFETAAMRPLRELPAPLPGLPKRHRPAGAKRNLAWVSTLAPKDVGPKDHNPGPYVRGFSANIHRALSLVPEEVTAFFDIAEVMYMPAEWMRRFDQEFRAVSHAQSELIAARLSAINRCIY